MFHFRLSLIHCHQNQRISSSGAICTATLTVAIGKREEGRGKILDSASKARSRDHFSSLHPLLSLQRCSRSLLCLFFFSEVLDSSPLLCQCFDPQGLAYLLLLLTPATNTDELALRLPGHVFMKLPNSFKRANHNASWSASLNSDAWKLNLITGRTEFSS